MPPWPWPASSGALVAEVVTGGASASDEYVELTNAATSPVDLGGLELVYATSTGSTVTRKATWTSPRPLEPGQHLLVANAAGAYAALADATYSGGFAATGGALAMRPVGGTPIDAVGWGDATNAFVEGVAASAPPAGSSIERRPGGSAGNVTDTNDNATDWLIQAAPEPRNLASPPFPVTEREPDRVSESGPERESESDNEREFESDNDAEPDADAVARRRRRRRRPHRVRRRARRPRRHRARRPHRRRRPRRARRDDADAEPDADGRHRDRADACPTACAVTVEGVVTVGLGAIESGRSGFVQDETAGIAIYLDATRHGRLVSPGPVSG